MRNSEFRQTAGDSPKARADGFDGQMHEHDGSGSAKRDQDGARDFPRVLQAINLHANRKKELGGSRYPKRIPPPPKTHLPGKKNPPTLPPPPTQNTPQPHAPLANPAALC